MDILESIIGKEIQAVRGLEIDNENVAIDFTDGTTLEFYHAQECCEWVRLHDFELTVSDVDKLKGGIVNDAREDTNDEENIDTLDEFHIWTFYNINTSKGCINMRWLGESNGYYSVDVRVRLVQ